MENIRMNLKSIRRIENMVRDNPEEAFEIEGSNFVIVSAEYYDYLKHCTDYYNEVMKKFKRAESD